MSCVNTSSITTMARAYKGRLPNKKVWRSGQQVTLLSGSPLTVPPPDGLWKPSRKPHGPMLLGTLSQGSLWPRILCRPGSPGVKCLQSAIAGGWFPLSGSSALTSSGFLTAAKRM